MYTTSPDGIDAFIHKRGPGQCFGEESLYTDYNKCHTSVSTDTYCVMFTVSHADFQLYLKAIGSDATLWASVYNTNLVPFLRSSPVLSPFDDAQLGMIACLVSTSVFAPEDRVFEKDEADARSMFLVLKGQVATVEFETEGTDGVEGAEIASSTKTFTSGQWFGDESMLLEMPRSNTAVVRGNPNEICVLAELSLSTLENYVSIAPNAATPFKELKQNHTLERIMGCNVPFLKAIPDHRLSDLVVAARVLDFEADDIIIKEGDAAKEFYILAHGTADVFIKDRFIVNLATGKYFGEIGLVADIPRTATVRAHSKVVCFAFSRDTFSSFFDGQPEAYAEFSIKLSRDSVPIEPMLVHDMSRSSLYDFCKREHSVENLDFYLAVEAFRKRPDNDPSLAAEACAIWDQFISPGKAPSEVNLKADNIDLIRLAIENTSFTPTMYDDAQQEIVYLMKDTLQRFKKTEEFQKLLEKIGKYEATPVVKKNNQQGEQGEEELKISVGHHKTVVTRKERPTLSDEKDDVTESDTAKDTVYSPIDVLDTVNETNDLGEVEGMPYTAYQESPKDYNESPVAKPMMDTADLSSSDDTVANTRMVGIHVHMSESDN